MCDLISQPSLRMIAVIRTLINRTLAKIHNKEATWELGGVMLRENKGEPTWE